jgi:DNA-binding SARP family transcriptional activator
LAGFYARDAVAFEEWVAAQRERLHQLALHTLATATTTRHSYMAATDASTRLLILEPWREDTHRKLMQLLAASGQRSAAVAQYASCQRVLATELGVDPMPRPRRSTSGFWPVRLRWWSHLPTRPQALRGMRHRRRRYRGIACRCRQPHWWAVRPS